MVLEGSVHRLRVRGRIHPFPIQGRVLRKEGGRVRDGVFFVEVVGGARGLQRAGCLSRGVKGLHPPNVLLGVCPHTRRGSSPHVHNTSLNTASSVCTTGLVTVSERHRKSRLLRVLAHEVAHLGGLLSPGQAIGPSRNVLLSSLIRRLLLLAGI